MHLGAAWNLRAMPEDLYNLARLARTFGALYFALPEAGL